MFTNKDNDELYLHIELWRLISLYEEVNIGGTHYFKKLTNGINDKFEAMLLPP